jgi:hypothetical protein
MLIAFYVLHCLEGNSELLYHHSRKFPIYLMLDPLVGTGCTPSSQFCLHNEGEIEAREPMSPRLLYSEIEVSKEQLFSQID